MKNLCVALMLALIAVPGSAQFQQRIQTVTPLANGDVRGTFATWTAPNAQTVSLGIDLYGTTTHIVTWVAGPASTGPFDIRIMASRDGQTFTVVGRTAAASGKAVFRGTYRAIGIQVPALTGTLDATYYGTNSPQPDVPQLCSVNGASWDSGIWQLTPTASCSCSAGQVTACLF